MSRFVITTGPESSGKTTLALQLAHTLDAPLVTEVARTYFGHQLDANPDWRYAEQDLHAIALQHHAAERTALALRRPLVVCDTDLLVIRIWSEEKYHRIAPALATLLDTALLEDRLFLLCSPDMPWEPDPLRENPADRWRLFDRYLDTLERLKLTYLVLAGDRKQRLRAALDLLGRNPLPEVPHEPARRHP